MEGRFKLIVFKNKIDFIDPKIMDKIVRAYETRWCSFMILFSAAEPMH